MYVYRVMDAREKFGEHERFGRVARGSTYMFLNFYSQLNSVGRRNRCWKAALEPGAWISRHFHSSRLQKLNKALNTNDYNWWSMKGSDYPFHKNYKLCPTYPRLAIFYWQLKHFHTYSFARITPNEPVCFEGWKKISVPIWSPWEPDLKHKPVWQLSLTERESDFLPLPVFFFGVSSAIADITRVLAI